MEIPSRGGGGPSGGNDPLRVSNQGAHAPSGGNGPLGFSTLGALGPWVGRTIPSVVPTPLQPVGPSGIGGHIRWTPGTLPVVPVQYR